MIRVEGLTRRYGDRVVLDQVSLSLPNHGLIAVLGPSGSGKTTLLRLLGLLDEPSDGSLYVDEENIANWNAAKRDDFRHANIGFVFQDYNLIPHLTVEENIALPFSLRKGSDAKDKIEALIERFGLQEVRHQLPKQLSGGEAQRVAVARAIALDQKIILADEPTAALDEENAHIIVETLKEISKDALVVLVTHNEELVKDQATALLRLHQGKIVENTLEIPQESSVLSNVHRPAKASTLFSLPWKRVVRSKKHYALFSSVALISVLSVCLTVSLRFGTEKTVSQIETDLLSSLPIVVDRMHVDFTSAALGQAKGKPFPSDGYVHAGTDENAGYHVNAITDAYLSYLSQGIDPTIMDVAYGTSYPVLSERKDHSFLVSATSGNNGAVDWLGQMLGTNDSFYSLNLTKEAFLQYYEPLSGHYPENENEGFLLLNRSDAVTGGVASILDMDTNKVPYGEILGKKFRFLSNDEYFTPTVSTVEASGRFLKTVGALKAEDKNPDGVLGEVIEGNVALANGDYEQAKAAGERLLSYFEPIASSHTMTYYTGKTSAEDLRALYETTPEKQMTLAGIFRPKKTSLITPLPTSGIYFLPTLGEKILQENESSAIAEEMRYHLYVDPHGETVPLPKVHSILDSAVEANAAQSEIATALYNHFAQRKSLGVDPTIASISFRPRTLQEAKRVRDYLDRYNEGKSVSEAIYYQDSAASMNAIVDTFYSLFMALMAVILIVVSLTCGLIVFLVTALEVEKRKREIAILRSLGASKGFVSSLFALEQSWIAFVAGIASIALDYALLPFINMGIDHVLTQYEIPSFAFLPFPIALALFGISVLFFFLVAFLPSYRACRRPPSEYLKSE